MFGKDKGSLVAQLQEEVVDSRVPISDMLRKAKILASRLNNKDLKRWVDAELKGYDNADDLPEYRKLDSPNLGTFSGPFGRRATSVLIPVTLLPDTIRKFATDPMEIMHGVKEIETSATSGTKLRHPWPPEVVMLAREHIPMEDGSMLVEAWKPYATSQMDGILEQVRNRLLDFLLELQQIEPEVLESDDAIRSVPDDKVQNVFQTVIHGGHNIVATGTELTQVATQNVASGDTQSLIDHLRNIGLDDDSLAELETAIEQDGDRQKKKLGENVKAWMGKMIVKAMDGTWKVAQATAPDLLKAALSRFYGG